MSNDLALRLRIALSAEEGEKAIKRFQAVVESTLKQIGRTDAEIGIIRQLAAEVDAGKKKLSELPAEWRKDVAAIRQTKILDDLGINQSHDQIRTGMARLRAAFIELKQTGTLSHAELTQAASRTRDRIRELGEQMNGTRTHSAGLATGFARVQMVMTAIAGLTVGNTLIKTADAMQLLTGRLTLSEGSIMAAKERLGQLAEIAGKAGADIEATASGYAKMATSIRLAGGDTRTALRFTETLAMALKVSGSSAAEASAAMYQMGQSLQKGKLQGDEFVSIAENGGKVLDYLAEALGVSRGALAEMATAGELTTDKVLKLHEALDKVRRDSASLPQTVEASFTRMTNAAKLWVADASSVSFTGRALGGSFNLIAENINTAINALIAVGGVVVVAGIARLATAIRNVGLAAMVFAGMNPWVRGIQVAVAATALFSDKIGELWDKATGKGTDWQAAQARVSELRARFDEFSKTTASAVAKLNDRLGEARKELDKLGQEAIKAGQSLVSAIGDQAASRIRAIGDAASRQIDVLRNAGAAERDLILQTVAVHADAARQKAVEAERGAASMLTAWQRSHNAALDAARASGQDMAQLEGQSVVERQRILDTLAGHYRSVIDQMISETNRHLDAARRADEELSRFKMTTEDRIRALRQRGMDEASAYQDKLRQIDEKQAQAREALQRGDFENAKRLAEQAIGLAESSAREVTRRVEENGKSVTQTVISEAQASANAIAKIGEASKLVEQALKGQGDTHRQAAESARTAYLEIRDRLDDVAAQMDRLSARKIEGLTVSIEVNAEEIRAKIDEVEQIVKTKKLLLEVNASADAARKAIEADINNGKPLSIDARIAIDKAEGDIARLKAAQQADPLKLLASINTKDVDDALVRFRNPANNTVTVAVENRQALAATADVRRALDSIPNRTDKHLYIQTHEVAARAEGGPIFRRMAGAIRGPGTATSDSIPAMLSSGEFVMRAAAVNRWGLNFLHALNAGMLPAMPVPRFAAGGLVGDAGGAGGGDTVNINVSIGQKQVRLQGARDQAMALAGALRELSRGA